MPVFKGTIRVRDSLQAVDQEYSLNCHTNEDSTSDQAWQNINELAQAFAGTLLPDSCNIYSVSIYNPDVVNGNQTRAVSIDGARVVTGAPLPAWNVVRFQARASDGSRPSTFYLRVGMTEDDVTGQNLSAGLVTALNSFRTAFLAQGTLCTPAGAIFETAGYDELVRMRQMGWHRRTRPGFRRGWVPVTP